MANVSGQYADEMFERWSRDPTSVHPSWDVYFGGGGKTGPSSTAQLSRGGVAPQSLTDTVKLVHLIRAYQVRGHEHADLDPLKLKNRPSVPELDIQSYGFTETDLDRTMNLSDLSYNSISGFTKNADLDGDGTTTLREFVKLLQHVYCGPIGYEYMHIPDRTQCNWLRDRIEFYKKPRDKAWRLQVLERLAWAEMFESFAATKWNTTKRFGLEGIESMIPGLKSAVDTATKLGVEHIVFGMPHRGRLNVLSNVIRKPLEQIFKEFMGTHVPGEDKDGDGEWAGSGDVKYHLGTSFQRKYPDGREIHLSMLANPSHLEAVNPVVCGKAKAKMNIIGDKTGSKVMPIIIHGDAAFAGQGIVYETMQLAQPEGYYVGGTLHVVANNQVGFTTDPHDSRSTKYCSDIGKTFNCPIFHVNADYPEHVAEAFELATEWRQRFHTDVVIDIIGYRRMGHNELDQPMFTQPLLYTAIKKHPTVLKVHEKRLLEAGVFTQGEITKVHEYISGYLEKALEASKTYVGVNDWLSSQWTGMLSPKKHSAITKTGVPLDQLRHIGKHLINVPPGFTLHRQIQKMIDDKTQIITSEKGVDWATAEALAFGTLLQMGVHVRLSGEDVERGTFSHRHAVVHDQKNGDKHMFLKNIPGNKAPITVCNSPLSEYGVLGFDLGYSLESPNQLVLWEAQFGDFVNGAQIIIDQFLSCGEAKWLRQSGLVMLLPHGYDGQGPDHSSCRVERFLGACDEDPDVVPVMREEVRMQIQKSNWQIVNCTTPANYFHVLRRQIMRAFRKPLIVVSPKNMLKLRECTSSLEEMGEGTVFQRVFMETYPEELEEPSKIRRILYCSGKLYYELLAHRRKHNVRDVAIIRLEQIHPFPFDKVAEAAKLYSNGEVVWVQEEPKNMGCWGYVNDRFMTATRVLNGAPQWPAYIGRPNMASTAEGYGSVHAKTQQEILDTAICSTKVTDYGHGRSHKDDYPEAKAK